MRNRIFLAFAVTIVAVALIGLPAVKPRALGPQSFNKLSKIRVLAAAENETALKTVTVRAAEEVRVAPDAAYVNLSITTQNNSVQEAQRLNAETANAVVKAIGALGIDKQEITTSNYCMYPHYEYTAGESRQKGYIVSNSLRVKIEDFSLIGKVIDAAGANGANGIGGIEFAVLDSAAAYNAALEKAVETAKSKALTIAAAQQLQLGAAVTIKETEQHDNKISVFAARTFAETSTSINPDNLTVKAGVEITYSLSGGI